MVLKSRMLIALVSAVALFVQSNSMFDVRSDSHLTDGTPETTYYVDSQVAQSGDGLSWETAWKTIGEATSAVGEATSADRQPGTKVLIKPGTYYESIAITSSGAEIVPMTTGIHIAQGNTVTFPKTTDLSAIDIAHHPGQYYLYIARSWCSNNSVYTITTVDTTNNSVTVEGSLLDEQGIIGDNTHLSASIGRPVVYQKYSDDPQNERVILDASQDTAIYTILFIGTYIDPYDAEPANYNIIDGLDLTGSHNGGGVHIQNSRFNVVRNSRIYNQSGAGLLIGSRAHNPAEYNFVIQNVIYNTPSEGIYIGAGGHSQEYNHSHFNHIIDNELYTQGTAPNATFENAIDLKEYNRGNVIEGNIIRDFDLSVGGNGAIDIRNDTHDTLVYGNVLHNIHTKNDDTNYIINIYPHSNTVLFFNNIIYNPSLKHDAVYAINIHADDTNAVSLYHNTVHNIDNGLLLQYSTQGGTGTDNGVSVINTIFSNIGTTPIEEWTWNEAETGHFHLANNLFSKDPHMSDYPVAEDFIGDALFENGDKGKFHLTSASVNAIDKGATTMPSMTHDFDLLVRDSKPDIGAFEYGVAATATPTPNPATAMPTPNLATATPTPTYDPYDPYLPFTATPTTLPASTVTPTSVLDTTPTPTHPTTDSTVYLPLVQR